MTWPTEQAREAVQSWVGAYVAEKILSALVPSVAAAVRAERAAALREAAGSGYFDPVTAGILRGRAYAEEADR